MNNTLSAPIYTPSSTFTRPPKLNVLILDVSGSMGWAINKLAEDTILRVNNIPTGDAVTIGIFSSEGWFKWISTRELSGQEDYDLVNKSIKEDLYVRGMTCFSGILADTPQAIKPLLSKYSVVTLTFMSDGHPTVSNPQQEHNRILAACSELKNYIVAGAVVGYGDYANRPLLSEIAQCLGIEFVGVRYVNEIGEAFSKVTESKGSTKKTIKLSKKSDLTYYSTGSSVVPLNPTNEEEVTFPESSVVYSLNIDDADEERLYEMSVAYIQLGNLDKAVECLSKAGDVKLVDSLYNCLTNADLARVSGEIATACVTLSERFKGGKKLGCAPAEDQFDFLDCMNVLQENNYGFTPWEGFNYKRIGRSSVSKKGSLKFTIYPTQEPVTFNSLVGHATELNLSVSGLKIRGCVTLPNEAAGYKRVDISLPEIWDCSIFRSYSFISNALPNVISLEIKSNKTVDKRLENIAYDIKDGYSFKLDLTQLPACNKAKGKLYSNLDDLGKLALSQLELKNIIKVLKAKRDELDPEKIYSAPLEWTEEQRKFLNSVGISNANIFNPEMELEDPTDQLEYKEFSIKIAKSSDVTMADFNKKRTSPESLNKVGKLMLKGQEVIESFGNVSKGELLTNVIHSIEVFTAQKRKVDRQINEARFAIALSGSWRNFSNEDTKMVKIGDDEVTFNFVTKTKAI